MGYTHYWKTIEPLTNDDKWRSMRQACGLLVAASGVSLEVRITEKFILLNGIGSAEHEAFLLERETTAFSFCKTARKPYDVVVAATLAVANHLFKGSITVSSDGDMEDREWQEAMKLVESVFDKSIMFPCN